MPEPETTPSRDTVRRSLMVLLGDRYARAGEVTKAAQCYAIAFDGVWPNVDNDGLLDPSAWLDAPKPRVPSAPPLRVSGKLTLQGDGHATQHPNAILTAPNPFLDDPGWDGRPVRTDRRSIPVEFTIPRRHAPLAFWLLLATDIATAPPPQRPRVGTGWRIGLLAVALRALGYPTARPDPWDIGACGRAQQPDRPTLQLYDENWNYAITLAPKFAFPDTVARDYPPPAEPCQCIAATEPWWDHLRAQWKAVWDQIDRAHANRPPRTDFMPHYPCERRDAPRR
ncbi:hypothetical protein FK268_12710 [Tsukamurella sputi]|uniref:Uncharacterized protein n=1 Tax=Tsukamurella sputi TaxID=2591848 RepID=A0A5C5RP91_9ACTN|nr:hypothetical protein [Tsukamurella sputi]TWS24444.1 hypothetical protein FK268_12710 [Tsukamurella sputi]